jgi:hypothetical protein
MALPLYFTQTQISRCVDVLASVEVSGPHLTWPAVNLCSLNVFLLFGGGSALEEFMPS